jgi:hypothetical protein
MGVITKFSILLVKCFQSMNYKISFRELAESQKAILSRQQPVTLELARKQVEQLKKTSSQKKRK